MIRVVLPAPLCALAACEREVKLDVTPPVTVNSIVDGLEKKYPPLCGAIREHGAAKRRPLVRFFACGEDISHQPMDAPLPEEIASGSHPLYVIAAIAGG